MFTAAPPVLLTTIDWLPLLPTWTEPKLTLAGDADNCPAGAAAPVPLKAMLRAGLDALLLIRIDPVALPAAVGVNVARSVTFEDGFTVVGVVTPETA
jgi:hypothetical protein